MKWLLHIIFLLLFALVTFFGLGPVLMADGIWQERLLTALVVVMIYVILGYLYRKMVFKK